MHNLPEPSAVMKLVERVNDTSIDEVLEPAINERQRICLVAFHISAILATSQLNDLRSIPSAYYSDGYSVHLLARLSGKRHAQRLATTDLLPRLLVSLRKAGRSVLKVAYLGGEPGIALAASKARVHLERGDTTWASHGYHEDWSEVLTSLTAFEPDVVLVGLGMPLEAIWLSEHFEQLPISIYVTCGGLLRILAGEENRSPKFLIGLRLEWLYRWITDFKRVNDRYSRGALLILKTLWFLASKRLK